MISKQDARYIAVFTDQMGVHRRDIYLAETPCRPQSRLQHVMIGYHG